MRGIIHLSIDMQRRFLPLHDAEGALAEKAVAFVRQLGANGVTTIWTVSGATPGWERLTPATARRQMLRHGMPAVLEPALRGYLAIKTGDAAFTAPALLPYLRRRGARTLLLSGCYAAHCVRATAEMAAGLGLDCVLLADLLRDNRELDDAAQRYRRLYAQHAAQPHVSVARFAALLPWLTRRAEPGTRAAARAADFKSLHDALVF